MKRKDDPNIKANHYTTAEQYVDPQDGQTKQFTIIDHDIKTKVSASDIMSEKEKKELYETVQREAKERIEEILSFPAVFLILSKNTFAEDYIERHPEKGIIWREEMVRDALSVNTDLRYAFHHGIWRMAVRPEHWHNDISHEEILAGKWKEWSDHNV